MQEVNKRLQTQEAKKARALLSLAMDNYEAFKIVKADIEKKVLEANGFSKSGK